MIEAIVKRRTKFLKFYLDEKNFIEFISVFTLHIEKSLNRDIN